MSMKVNRITTYWEPADACNMLELLDELRDQLWESYADQIIEYRLSELPTETIDQRQLVMGFMDDDPF